MSTRRFEFKQAKSQKFWTVSQSGKSFTVTFGRIGVEGQKKTKQCASPVAAQAAMEKLVVEKLRKGYRELDARSLVAPPPQKSKPIKNPAKNTMKSVLKQLMTVMPAPAKPVLSKGDWKAVESELGTPLPGDYLEFVSQYGAGTIGDLPLAAFSPFADGRGSLLSQVKVAQASHEIFESFGPVPFPVFPEKGGLLKWGNTGNGDYLYWRTVGSPDAWHVVIKEGDSVEFVSFPKHNCTRFIYDVVTRRIAPFPKVFFNPTPAFSPYDLGKVKKSKTKKRPLRIKAKK